MKTLAIISEFNPFHNGHKYILDESIKKTNADIKISFMSGDFVQRGEASLIDKYRRADSSMKAGFDIVIEMPNFITLQSAEFFSYKSVEILNKMKIDYLCFGIENIEPHKFLEKVNYLIDNHDKFNELIIKNTKKMSYTMGKYEAIREIIDDDKFISSNNILALEYISAIDRLNSNIKPIPIKRHSSLNKEVSFNSTNFSSSTAIRNNIDLDIRDYVPYYSYQNIDEFLNKYEINNEYFYELFKYLLLIEKKDMKNVLGYEEGMENYFEKIIQKSNNFDIFIDNSTTKRYTRSRIKRVILNFLIGNYTYFNDIDIDFYKILTFNENSLKLIKKSKDYINPIIIKKDTEKLNTNNQLIYDSMIKASNLYSLSINRDMNIDYTYKKRRY